ncbi:hypothetical protein [Virgibacillus sp. DJP39]|uniref:DUF3108 domain-containing protein n=1 Tax=Virgibacillus sp. DJP39 TaxID=3409790 RepID=UPI003BB81360
MIDKTRIGEAHIQWDSMGESKDIKDVYLIENGIEKIVGTTTEVIKYLTLNGQQVIHREQVLTSDLLGDRKGITIVERNSFKPVSYSSYLDGKEVKCVYKGDYVQIRNNTQEKSILLKDKHSFDSFSVEMILRILPLKLEYATSFNAFKTSIESEIKIQIQVVGKEPIGKGENICSESWKVKTYFGDTFQYYWISVESKKLIKQSSQIGEGLLLEFR